MAKALLSPGIEGAAGRYRCLPAEWIPSLPRHEGDESWVQFARKLETLPDFYFHLGGAGDALLLLSTFYDEHPESYVLSVPNSRGAMEDFFRAFPRLKGVFFLPRPEHPQVLLLVRMVVFFLKKKGKCLGTGVTPSGDYQKEWKPGIDIFRTYGVAERPSWAKEIGEERLCPNQVAVAPRGSILGVTPGKQNIIPPALWEDLLADLVERGFTPVLLGTPGERGLYPAREGCLDQRSYSFLAQMRLIGGSDFVVAADSWHKTFAALLGKPTLLFLPLLGGPARFVPDVSQEVFIHPWRSIVPLKGWEDYARAAGRIAPAGKPGAPRRRGTRPLTSFSPLFWKREYEKKDSVLLLPTDAVGDALMTTAVAAALKESHPHLEISVSSKKFLGWIFRECPAVDRWVAKGSPEEKEVSLRAREVVDFNAVIAHLPEYLGGIHFMDLLANLAGVKLSGDALPTRPPREAMAWAEEAMEAFRKGRLLVGLHLQSGKDPVRDYPWGRQVVEALARRNPGIRFAWFGLKPFPGPWRSDLFDFAAYRVPLERQAAAVAFCGKFLCVDSGFFHLAQNLWGIPVHLLAGPTHPALIGNREKGVKIVGPPGLECAGCYWKRECVGTCILGLDPERAAALVLEEDPSRGPRAGFPLPEKELLLEGGEDYQVQIARALLAPGGPFRLKILDPAGLLPEYACRWNGVFLERRAERVREPVREA